MAKRDREETKKGMNELLASTGTDLVSDVIAGDRRRAGRGERKEKDYDTMTENNTIVPYDNKTVKQVRSEESSKAIKQKKTSRAPNKGHSSPGSKPALPAVLAARIADATRMAESPTMTVTLRIPQEMNDWLDGYVHGAWPLKVKKQELVVEGLRLLIARRGKPGEEKIRTELLPDE